MKTNHLILLIGLFSLTGFSASSQVKVFTGNKVLVGQDWWGSSYSYSEDLFVNGVGGFNHAPALSGLHFMNYPFGGGIQNLMSLIPQWGNTSLIGTSTQQMFQVHSFEIYGNGIFLASDEKLKTNVRKLNTSALDLILQLNAYRYDFKADYFNKSHKDMQPMLLNRSKNQIGLMAQEVRQILPELVKQDETTQNLSVNYIALIPLLVECIKEQQVQIEALKK